MSRTIECFEMTLFVHYLVGLFSSFPAQRYLFIYLCNFAMEVNDVMLLPRWECADFDPRTLNRMYGITAFSIVVDLVDECNLPSCRGGTNLPYYLYVFLCLCYLQWFWRDFTVKNKSRYLKIDAFIQIFMRNVHFATVS